MPSSVTEGCTLIPIIKTDTRGVGIAQGWSAVLRIERSRVRVPANAAR